MDEIWAFRSLALTGPGREWPVKAVPGCYFFVDIGSGRLLFKIRAKTMRGFKSWDKALTHPYLSQYLRGENGISDLRMVI